jgi:hypothetical protein
MFTKNHYINIISLLVAGIANSILLNNIFNPESVLLPAVFFLSYIIIILLIGNKLFPGNSHLVRVAMLLLSPALYYLLLAEYGFLVNAVLVLMVITFIYKYTDSNKADVRFYISALLIGVTLYVNFSLLLFYILFVLFFFRQSIPKIIIFTFSVAAVFVLIHYTGLFYNEGTGPKGLNSILLMLPVILQVMLLLITVYTGWMVADIQEVYFSGGILTFVPTVILALFKFEGIYSNAYTTILSSSYLSFTLILHVLSVKPYKTERYTGKVFSLSGN